MIIDWLDRLLKDLHRPPLSKRMFGPVRTSPAWIEEVDCPERDGKVTFGDCLCCDKFQVWDDGAGEEGIKRCKYEYEDLQTRDRNDGTQNQHPEDLDAETWNGAELEREDNERAPAGFEDEGRELEPRGRVTREESNKAKSDRESQRFIMDDEDEDEEDDEEADY